jgi:hypothetical protein
MMVSKHRDDLTQEREKLAQFLREREQIETKIAHQKRRVAALAELSDESEFADALLDLDLGGLTDVCRTAMRASRKEWLTIAEIQEAIKELGFPLHQYKAAGASITTTVIRLVDAGEVAIEKHAGANEYKWVGKAELLRRGEEITRGGGKK